MMNEMNTMLLRLLNTTGSSTAMTSPEPNEPIVFQDNGLDGDGLYQPEMTEIVLSSSSGNVIIADPDTEPAQIIDEAPTESDEAPEEAPEEEAVPEEAPEEEASAEEEHSEMPHFPDQIALIINEI
jgi:outer membrane biosynthesis protein TonB